MTAGDDTVLGRWARRRAAVAREEAVVVEPPPPVPAPPPEPPSAEQVEAREVPPDDETRRQWIEELEAIDVGALKYEDDFSMFLKGWVPQHLKNRALRQLWQSNPMLAVLDGLNDYDEDYTDAAMLAGKVVTSYMPGRGYATLEEIAGKVEELAGEAAADGPPGIEATDPAAAAAAAESDGPADGESTELSDEGAAPDAGDVARAATAGEPKAQG